MKKGLVILITLGIALVISNIISIVVLLAVPASGGFHNPDGSFTMMNYLRWELFWFLSLAIFANILISHKYAFGRTQELLFLFSALFTICEVLAYVIYTLIDCSFNFSIIDWFGTLNNVMVAKWFYIVFAILYVVFFLVYAIFINKDFIKLFGRSGIRGKGKLNQIEETNLENSRWMNEEEKRKIFSVKKYSELEKISKDGIPVLAKVTKNKKDMEVAFNKPCHSIVIGSTGSGKTTTFVSPMIQLLAATKAGSSMVITDPKGELFNMHSQFLLDRGYDVKVVDLRDTYESYRWNPLDTIWDSYEQYVNAHKKAFKRHDNVTESGLELAESESRFEGTSDWYEFEGKAYARYEKLVSAVKLYKKKIFDEVYEDLNDLVTVLIPIENEKDPMWEKGARSITLAVLLAMLEDSANPELGMTKEKYNFFNLTKILQNSSKDYEDLRNYFKGRSPLSKAYSLSKQVCDAATQTRASYMSIVYEKLTLFNDAGICALTSASDFSADGLSERPTALFLKIPDEKDTRHNLAAIFILNIYKTLIKIASATEGLTLPRNVYFIMDEFGNMPKIEKFDKFITVGRSRKIWFTMIVQSYAQLNNVYGETVADIVKGNCGIKMFIGSNDMNTCKEYSELCGNITVATTSTSGSAHGETSYSTQMQVRPLIYPSELQRLNKPGDIGHSIIVTFGNYPFKTYFTPQFNAPFYKIGKMDSSELEERFFNENDVFYNIKNRNKLLMEKQQEQQAKANEVVQTPPTNNVPEIPSIVVGQMSMDSLKDVEPDQNEESALDVIEEDTTPPIEEKVNENPIVSIVTQEEQEQPEAPVISASQETIPEPVQEREEEAQETSKAEELTEKITEAENPTEDEELMFEEYRKWKKDNPGESFVSFFEKVVKGEIMIKAGHKDEQK